MRHTTQKELKDNFNTVMNFAGFFFRAFLPTRKDYRTFTSVYRNKHVLTFWIYNTMVLFYFMLFKDVCRNFSFKFNVKLFQKFELLWRNLRWRSTSSNVWCLFTISRYLTCERFSRSWQHEDKHKLVNTCLH